EASEARDRRADRAADLRDRSFAADGGAGAERDRGPERLHDHPPPLHAGPVQVEHLEEAREAVAEHLAGKEPVEAEERQPAGNERERDPRAPEGCEPALEEPGGAGDRLAEDDVAHRPEDARHDREPDAPGVAAVSLDDVPQVERGLHDAAATSAAAR